jgi:hypothetical protein
MSCEAMNMKNRLSIKLSIRRLTSLLLLVFLPLALSMAADKTPTNSPKLTTIQSLYALSTEKQLGSEVLLERYSSESFKQALALERQVAETGMVCGSGGDIMWQSQDTDFQEPVIFALDAEDRVVVQLSDRDTLSYVLTCEEDRCLIEDIHDFGGSVKEMLLTDCQ